MAKYTKVPQYDLEMQSSGGQTIKSITISRFTRPDGVKVRRKVTLLCDGSSIVDDREVPSSTATTSMSSRSQSPLSPSSSRPLPSNIQSIPTTIDTPRSTTDVFILPQHYDMSKKYKQRCKCTGFHLVFTSLTVIFLIAVFLQIMIFWGGQWTETIMGFLGVTP